MTSLVGRRVLVPRAQGRAGPLITLLGEFGADAQAVPLFAIGPPDDTAALDSAVLALGAGDYDWVAFASANAVDAVLNRARALAITPAVPADTRVAAVGPATALAMRTAGFPVDLRNEHEGSAAGLAKIWPFPTHPVSRVLLPTSSIGLPTLPLALAIKGYQVDRVDAYAPRPVPMPVEVARDLEAGRYFAVLLTSPSIATVLADTVTLPGTVLVGCIGEATAAAARRAGLAVQFVAVEPTMTALTGGLVEAAASAGIEM